MALGREGENVLREKMIYKLGRCTVVGVVVFSATLIFTLTPAEAAEKKSGIKGKVVFNETGEPVTKTYIYAYVGKMETRPAQMGIIGITDWVSYGSAEDGTYQLDLPPGKYYVVARKRASGLNYGPLYRGDWYDHSTAKQAIVVKKGKYAKCDFKLRQLREPMFFQGLTAAERRTDTGIRGKLINEEGEHIPGTFVMAFLNDDMQRVPDFTSSVTDDEGNYTMYLPRGGRYWIAARFGVMRVPKQGEPFAHYEGSSDHSIEVQGGQFLEGIDLILKPYDGDPPDKLRIH